VQWDREGSAYQSIIITITTIIIIIIIIIILAVNTCNCMERGISADVGSS
jgi:hypothetical protein